MDKIKCDVCGKIIKQPEGSWGTGYGNRMANASDKFDPDKVLTVCYECCGKEDWQAMLDTGKATLYLSMDQSYERQPFADGWREYRRPHGVFGGNKPVWFRRVKVTNWPGSLSFAVDVLRVGRHNMAGTRYDVWFSIQTPAGVQQWHGVTYGDNTQICHCQRVGKDRK